MGNLVLNISNVGTVSLTVVLVGCATFLLWNGSPGGLKLLNLAVYCVVWHAVWSAAHQMLRWALDAQENRSRLGIHPGDIVFGYIVTFGTSAALTAIVAYFILRQIE